MGGAFRRRLSGSRAVSSEFDFPEVHLSQETERAFAWLRSQCPLNPDLEKHLVGYAKLTGITSSILLKGVGQIAGDPPKIS